MKKIRIIALVLAVLMMLPVLVSCSSSPTAMTVGSYKVSYDMLRYLGNNAYVNRKLAELQQKLTDNTNASLRELAAYYLLAKEHKIKLSSEQKKEIDEQVKALRDGYNSEKDYEADMKKNFITEEVYREIITVQAYCDGLYEYLTDEVTGIFKHDDATIMGDIEAGNFFSAEYIYVNYGEKDRESRKKFAEDIQKRISKGEEMAIVYAEYENEYLLSADYVTLGAFTYHEQNEYFEEAVVSLEIGECSEVIEKENMFLIVKRRALSDEYIDKNFNSIIASYLSREFFDHVEEYSKALEIKMKGKYKELKYWEIE